MTDEQAAALCAAIIVAGSRANGYVMDDEVIRTVLGFWRAAIHPTDTAGRDGESPEPRG